MSDAGMDAAVDAMQAVLPAVKSGDIRAALAAACKAATIQGGTDGHCTKHQGHDGPCVDAAIPHLTQAGTGDLLVRAAARSADQRDQMKAERDEARAEVERLQDRQAELESATSQAIQAAEMFQQVAEDAVRERDEAIKSVQVLESALASALEEVMTLTAKHEALVVGLRGLVRGASSAAVLRDHLRALLPAGTDGETDHE